MKPGSQALRKGRVSVAGQVYLVTFTTDRRRHLFHSWEVASDAARLMTSAMARQDDRLLAWVVMPDHWHGLIELAGGTTLSTCIRCLKGGSAHALRRQHSALGQIWAPGYHDHAIRGDEDLLESARYLVMNPVRAGLVTRVGDYPFWDAIWLSRRVPRECPVFVGAASAASS